MTSWVDVFREVRHGGSGKGLLAYFRPGVRIRGYATSTSFSVLAMPCSVGYCDRTQLTPNGRPHETCTSAVARARADAGRGARARPGRWRRGGVLRTDFHARGRVRPADQRRAARGRDRWGVPPLRSPELRGWRRHPHV